MASPKRSDLAPRIPNTESFKWRMTIPLKNVRGGAPAHLSNLCRELCRKLCRSAPPDQPGLGSFLPVFSTRLATKLATKEEGRRTLGRVVGRAPIPTVGGAGFISGISVQCSVGCRVSGDLNTDH